MRQKHPSGLDEVFVDPLALPPTFALPAGDGAFVEAESRNYRLNRTAVGQHAVTMVAISSCGLCDR